MSIYINIILSILSGIVSSLVFYLIVFKVKPKIVISDNIALEESEGVNKIARVKVVNRSKFMLINVQYSLYLCTVNYGDKKGKNEICEILPMKERIHTLSKYSCKKKNTMYGDYAIRFTYVLKPEYIPKNDDKLIFVFTSTHSFSNISKCYVKEYSAKNLVYGDFELNESTKIR